MARRDARVLANAAQQQALLGRYVQAFLHAIRHPLERVVELPKAPEEIQGWP
jgi:hypothetical protein